MHEIFPANAANVALISDISTFSAHKSGSAMPHPGASRDSVERAPPI